MVSIPPRKMGIIEGPVANAAPDVEEPFVFMMGLAKPMGIGGILILSIVQVYLHIAGEACVVRPNDISHKLQLLTDSVQKPVGVVQLVLEVSLMQLFMHLDVQIWSQTSFAAFYTVVNGTPL